MKTKWIALLLTLVTLLSTLPFASAAQENEQPTTTDFLFALTPDGEVLTDGESVPTDATVYTLPLTMRAAELRRVSPSGIRFVTALDKNAYDALRACPVVASVELGTLILPLDLFGQEGEASYDPSRLDVAATPDVWYGVEEDAYLFAGSILSVKAQNASRDFVGVGYAVVTLTSGTSLPIYATPVVGCYGDLARALLSDPTMNATEGEKTFFGGEVDTMYKTDLKGLNVLAIGDSLFDGDYLRGNQQWIGLIADACKWHFTNLGHDGWTVAYNPGVYAEGQTVRKSMYDYLYNHEDIYCFGGDNASHKRGTTWGKSKEDVDLILLEGGVNDYGWNIPLGTVNDTDGSTLLGAWKLIIDKLLVDYPNARIVFVTSWYVEASKTTNGVLMNRMDYVCHGIKELFATHYSAETRLTMIEAGDPAVSGVNMASSTFRRTYGKSSSDTNHLNATGMKLMQTAMLPLLWETMTK